jgi:hypothetical protein
MKQALFLLLLLSGAGAVAQTPEPRIPRGAPNPVQKPVPAIKHLKPDLTVEIDEITGVSYDAALRLHRIAVKATIKNLSGADARNIKLRGEMEHAGHGADHIYYQPCREDIVIPMVRVGQIITATYVFLKAGRPGGGFTHPFRLMIDAAYAVAESNEENNLSNVVEVTAPPAE